MSQYDEVLQDLRQLYPNSPKLFIASGRLPLDKVSSEGIATDVSRSLADVMPILGNFVEMSKLSWITAGLTASERAWLSASKESRAFPTLDFELIESSEGEKEQLNIVSALLWSLHHRLIHTPYGPNIGIEFWNAWEAGYVSFNRRLAERISTLAKGTEGVVTVWVLDHLVYLLPVFLKELLGDRVSVLTYSQSPWPDAEAWNILPEQFRSQFINSFLASDRLVFQTHRDEFNFKDTCQVHLATETTLKDDVLYFGEMPVEIRVNPFSVNTNKIQQFIVEQQTKAIYEKYSAELDGRKMLLITDYVEPNKNFLRTLEAFQRFLEKYPDLRDVCLFLFLLPPRISLEDSQYKKGLGEIGAYAATINAEYTRILAEPVRVVHGGNYFQVVAAMQLYDVMIVNTLWEGMNLGAKEGVFINEKSGVLILSELAGERDELGDYSIEVSPFDIEGVADAIFEALTMPNPKKEFRAKAMRQQVEKHDVISWIRFQFSETLSLLKSP